MTISIVIPVHNSVPFLDKCINSVLPQLNSSDEILLMENGSTDDSWKLCEQYSMADNRIHAFSLGPCGVSAARNKGIELATCEWLCFLDADDYLGQDALASAHKWSADMPADILSFDYLPTDETGKVIGNEDDIVCSENVQDPIVVDPNLVTRSILQFALYKEKALNAGFNHITIWTCWAKFFRKSFLLEKQISFPVGLVLSEDTVFMTMASLKAKNIFSFRQKIYRYRLNKGSATSTLHPELIKNNGHLRKIMYNIIKKEDSTHIFRSELASFLTRKLIEETIYIKKVNLFDREKAVCYVEEALHNSFMRNAVRICKYTYIVPGKKDSLLYASILWCLKHGKVKYFFR